MLGCMSSVATDPNGVASGPSIALANAEHSRRRQVWQSQRVEQFERRRVLRAVDDFLTTVEEINLVGQGRHPDPLMPHRLRRLEALIGRRVPDTVRGAANGQRLHEALLDWQEELLDEANPSRRLYSPFATLAAGGAF